MRNFIGIALLASALATTTAGAQPTIDTLPGLQMRIGTNSVTADGPGWLVTASIAHDNNNTSSFRQWWHFRLSNIDPSGPTNIRFSLSGGTFVDNITPVWSLDDGATYTRIPNPGPSGPVGAYNFSVTVPAGVESIRISRYYPYTLPEYAAFRASINTHPYVTETESPQTTTLGNKLYMYEITNPLVSPVGKQRVWIHSAVHPSENTAHFQTEGLINFLLSGHQDAEKILEHVIFNIVPVANPDGVQVGNYRVNADSINLENQWASPYNQTMPEIVFMRTQIENFMGTTISPGANPIKLLLNLHATHCSCSSGEEFPYHFVHNGTWFSPGDPGVKPSVNQIELDWVAAFRARSPYVDMGFDRSSTLGAGRVFVEAMMHDRYSINPQWDDVMAITFEGTYQSGPTPGVPNTPDDYRQVGMETALAIADYFNIALPSESNVEGWFFHSQ